MLINAIEKLNKSRFFPFFTENYSISMVESTYVFDEQYLWITNNTYLIIKHCNEGITIKTPIKFLLISVFVAFYIKETFQKTNIYLNDILVDESNIESVIKKIKYKKEVFIKINIVDENSLNIMKSTIVWVLSPYHDDYYFKTKEETRVSKL